MLGLGSFYLQWTRWVILRFTKNDDKIEWINTTAFELIAILKKWLFYRHDVVIVRLHNPSKNVGYSISPWKTINAKITFQMTRATLKARLKVMGWWPNLNNMSCISQLLLQTLIEKHANMKAHLLVMVLFGLFLATRQRQAVKGRYSTNLNKTIAYKFFGIRHMDVSQCFIPIRSTL